MAQADWLGPKVGSCPAVLCIHQMNQLNPCNSFAIMKKKKKNFMWELIPFEALCADKG